MVELLLHYTLPLAILMYTFDFRKEYKKILTVSLLGIAPDFDALLHIHRSMSHSIIPYTIALTLILLFIKSHEIRKWSIIGYLIILSHLILDMFAGSTPILWPLIPNSICFETNITALIAETITIKPEVDVGIERTVFTKFTSLDAPIATSQGVAITVVLLTSPILKILLNHNANTTKPVTLTMNKTGTNLKLIFELWYIDPETGKEKYYTWTHLYLNVTAPPTKLT